MNNIRTWMQIVEGDNDKPSIDARISGDIVWIDMMKVPKSSRRKGIGTEFYNNWEKNLPDNIKLVRLLAADTNGNGNSDQFWESLGFDWQYNGEDLDYEAQHMMWKGINGNATPATIQVDDEDVDTE